MVDVVLQRHQGFLGTQGKNNSADICRIDRHATLAIQFLGEPERFVKEVQAGLIICRLEIIISDLIQQKCLFQQNRNIFINIQTRRN